MFLPLRCHAVQPVLRREVFHLFDPYADVCEVKLARWDADVVCEQRFDGVDCFEFSGCVVEGHVFVCGCCDLRQPDWQFVFPDASQCMCGSIGRCVDDSFDSVDKQWLLLLLLCYVFASAASAASAASHNHVFYLLCVPKLSCFFHGVDWITNGVALILHGDF